MTTEPPDPLTEVRRPCTALPEVEERLSHGEPRWFIRDAYLAVAPKASGARDV